MVAVSRWRGGQGGRCEISGRRSSQAALSRFVGWQSLRFLSAGLGLGRDLAASWTLVSVLRPSVQAARCEVRVGLRVASVCAEIAPRINEWHQCRSCGECGTRNGARQRGTTIEGVLRRMKTGVTQMRRVLILFCCRVALHWDRWHMRALHCAIHA